LEGQKAKVDKIFYGCTFAILENCFTFALTKDGDERSTSQFTLENGVFSSLLNQKMAFFLK